MLGEQGTDCSTLTHLLSEMTSHCVFLWINTQSSIWIPVKTTTQVKVQRSGALQFEMERTLCQSLPFL